MGQLDPATVLGDRDWPLACPHRRLAAAATRRRHGPRRRRV